jgi:hypothetical protein
VTQLPFLLIRQPLTREALDAWQKLIATSQELEQEIEAGSREMLARVFHTMFLYMGLQLLVDPKMAKDALEVCLNKLSVTVYKWLILLSQFVAFNLVTCMSLILV